MSKSTKNVGDYNQELIDFCVASWEKYKAAKDSGSEYTPLKVRLPNNRSMRRMELLLRYLSAAAARNPAEVPAVSLAFRYLRIEHDGDCSIWFDERADNTIFEAIATTLGKSFNAKKSEEEELLERLERVGKSF